MTYTYDPTAIGQGGKDQMRFELGDTDLSKGGETCVLSDEEYLAVLTGIGSGKSEWLHGKLTLVEGILHKLAYQVDTKIDVMEYDLSQRVSHWEFIYEKLKKEIQRSCAVPSLAQRSRENTAYFYSGMQNNPRI